MHYSVADPFPSYRSDIAELFAIELFNRGMKLSWFMRGAGAQVGRGEAYQGQEVSTPTGRFGPFSYWVDDIIAMIRAARHGADAIQCRDKYIASLVALVVARASKKKFFYWCSYPFPEHGMVVAESLSGWQRVAQRLKSRLRFEVLYRFICVHADHVFVQSTAMLEDMAAYGIPRERMTPVPMGVPANITAWTSTNRVDVVPGRFVHLGTLAAVRKLDMLLDAFVHVIMRHPEAELVFVGDGDHPSERHALEERARALGLQDHVRFTGFLPMEDAWRWTASAAVCLSPFEASRVLRVASPTKLVEYMALGRPVIGNEHPEQSEVIAASGAGLSVPWGAEHFARAMTQCLDDPQAAEAMAARGPAWVAKHRTYPIIADRLWKTYQRLLGASI